MHDVTRGFAIAGFLALLPVANSVSGQSIEPYYADTSSYETPAFLIKDMYAPPISACLIVSGESVEVEGSAIRITLAVRPFPSCDVPGGRDLTVNRIVGLPAPLAAGAYTVDFGYLIDGNRVFLPPQQQPRFSTHNVRSRQQKQPDEPHKPWLKG